MCVHLYSHRVHHKQFHSLYKLDKFKESKAHTHTQKHGSVSLLEIVRIITKVECRVYFYHILR